MNKRTTTGLLIAVGLAVLIHVRGWGMRMAWFVCMTVAMWEVYRALEKKDMKPIKWVGLLYCAAALPCYLFLGGEGGLVLGLVASLLVGMSAVLLTGKPDFMRAVATVFPIVYPGFLFSLMFPLQDQIEPMMCLLALLMLFVIPLMGDVGAYLVGSKWGKRKLCPQISPHKTVEGAVGGLVFSVASAIICSHVAARIPEVFTQYENIHVYVGPVWHYALLGLTGGVVAQFGDLTASMLKRYCGIKDFGNLFPGHGGMLDRFDSVLFMGVVTYAYFILLRG